MAIEKDTVQKVAHLSRIDLSEEELRRLSSQLAGIVDFIDKLKKINIENIVPTSHILPINNVLREDACGKSLDLEKTLKNAPQRKENFFGVPKVIE
ncbi:MAG: Asp-tRNA(Asn)/Glu-tRNA(Gln) amidotransferase subunit GatC [Candidatus Omnitrophica bacterium]|nr:Asp-tRNA(Asn)/Glu-tRNA(Gln) amidotransferase subunit GatC [Candidatus Omnitrophota bacterium]